MTDITKITDEQLTAELERRRKERITKARAERAERHKRLLAALSQPDVMAMFSHSRTSCSDDNIANGMGSWRPEVGRTAPRCGKCALLEFVQDQWIPDDVEVSIQMNFNRVTEE